MLDKTIDFFGIGFKKIIWWEWIMILVSLAFSIFALIYFRDSDAYYIVVLSVFASFFGVVDNLFITKRLLINYFFGVIHVTLYGFVAFYSLYYGDFILNIVFYLPMQFIGFWLWIRNKDHDDIKEEFEPKALSLKQYLIIIPIVAISYVGFAEFLTFLGGGHPWLDASSTVFSVLGMFLMAFLFWEQYIIWFIVNCISISMWVVYLLSGDGDGSAMYAIIFIYMWSVFLFISIIGFVRWFGAYRKHKHISGNDVENSRLAFKSNPLMDFEKEHELTDEEKENNFVNENKAINENSIKQENYQYMLMIKTINYRY